MKDLKTSDFDEFRDLFETKYLFLTGQELKPNQDLFDLNEIFRFEIEAAIKGERDPLVEMFFDWKAASERHADGDIFKSIEINKERFGLSEQLAEILKNTATRFYFGV